MKNPFATLLIVISLIIFGITTLIIFRDIRKKNYDLVNSIAKKSRFGQADVNFGKYYQAYKLYYKMNGWNMAFLLNIVSYPAVVVGALWECWS